MRTRTDKTLLILTALFVGGLALVAGAISFDHMRELATHHDQTGWKSYAFPISVDGLEIVASVYLVAQRRTGRATGWVHRCRANILRLRYSPVVGSERWISGFPSDNCDRSVRARAHSSSASLRTLRAISRNSIESAIAADILV